MSRSHLDSTTARVVPAQVNFLTIYNPILGDTEETERNQVVFWASKIDLLKKENRRTRKDAKSHGQEQTEETPKAKSEDEDWNNKLRQIGLARGMVEFVKNFSNDKPVDSIDTEKSRIVLHELENGWWLLASIDLTRLPAAKRQTSTNSNTKDGSSAAVVSPYEYSSREVAPAPLLLAQVLRAHRIFLLHHAATLWDIYNKVGRSAFCTLLEKYWGKFVWDWDVLFHGSPAVDVYGCCTKLGGGGELGFGVGEEEWGSGEREVLEGFMERTEGLVDLVVGRYGDSPVDIKKRNDTPAGRDSEKADVVSDPWLGDGEDPGPADGIIFSGVGTISRGSLATVSQWMEAIFKYGEVAYGVGENPNAPTRQKRKARQRPRTARKVSEDPETPKNKTATKGAPTQTTEVHPRYKSPRDRAPDLRRKAIENNATPPGIPAPIVGQVERSLDEALTNIARRSSSRSPTTSPRHEKTQEDAMNGANSKTTNKESDSTNSWFGADKMTKVLTLGYGSSWTLNPKGFQDQNSEPDKVDKKGTGESTSTRDAAQPPDQRPKLVRVPSKPAEDRLQELDPNPAVSDDDNDKSFRQRLEKSVGRFLVGLSGDLENTEFDGDDDDTLASESSTTHEELRIYHRTLTVQIPSSYGRPTLVSAGRTVSQDSFLSDHSRGSDGAPKTSAGASIDGPASTALRYEKLRVAVYVHQPFIFVFLFTLHTPNLTIPSFYRSIHHQLGPLQGPLLKRTNPDRVAERIKDVIMTKDTKTTESVLSRTAAAGNVVFDLIYDPAKLTVRTSIPNIPVPTTTSNQDGEVARSTMVSGSWYTLGIPVGSGSSPSKNATSRSDQRLRHKAAEQWSRIDALNVHGQILNSWISTRTPDAVARANANTKVNEHGSTSAEIERSVKTSRGWWVLWMKVPSTVQAQHQSTPRSSSRQATDTSDMPPEDDSETPTPKAISPGDQRQAQSFYRPQPLTTNTHKEAFLIRKSTDASTTKVTASTKSSGSGGRWLLRDQSRDASRGSNASSGGQGDSGARSISEGVGIDARRWVEGLLHLST